MCSLKVTTKVATGMLPFMLHSDLILCKHWGSYLQPCKSMLHDGR